MKATDRENAEVALTETERRPVTLEFQHAWQESISTPCREFDSIDEECDFDPLLIDRPSGRRTIKETNRVLSILNELERTANP